MTSAKLTAQEAQNCLIGNDPQTHLAVPSTQIVAWQETLLDLAGMSQNIRSIWSGKADTIASKISNMADAYVIQPHGAGNTNPTMNGV